MERLPGLELSVSATTRGARPGEREGIDYHFLPREEFDSRVAAGEFVEHADYAGRSYGTLRSELEDRLLKGVPVVLEIEVQGARQVRTAMPEAVQVFIAPPSVAALRTRLVGRGTDDPEEVERRLRVAEQELEAQPEFAHVVVNDRLDEALARLSEIVEGELERVDSNYASVVVAAKRARQINSYYHNLGEGTFDEFPPPMIETSSKNYLTIALEEVAAGKIKYHYR
jgi:guanylate kinase